MSTAAVNLDKTQYVRINVGYTSMLLQAYRDSVKIVLSTLKPALGNTAFHLLGGGDAPLSMPTIDDNLWALAMSDDSSLTVTETEHQSVINTYDGLELAKGNVPGHTIGTAFGHNQNLDPANPAMIWDYGETQPIEVYLLADTELFLSSSSASDVNVGLMIVGSSEGYIPKAEFHLFTSGQSQQSIGNWFRIDKITVISGNTHLGDIYCAEADTLTAGIPDTAAGVHGWIHDGKGTTHKAVGTVPAGHTMYITRLFLGTRRGEDCVFGFFIKTENMPAFIETSDFPLYQNTLPFPFDPPFAIGEKTDFYFLGTTVTNNTQASANFAYILVDNSVAP